MAGSLVALAKHPGPWRCGHSRIPGWIRELTEPVLPAKCRKPGRSLDQEGGLTFLDFFFFFSSSEKVLSRNAKSKIVQEVNAGGNPSTSYRGGFQRCNPDLHGSANSCFATDFFHASL